RLAAVTELPGGDDLVVIRIVGLRAELHRQRGGARLRIGRGDDRRGLVAGLVADDDRDLGRRGAAVAVGRRDLGLVGAAARARGVAGGGGGRRRAAVEVPRVRE